MTALLNNLDDVFVEADIIKSDYDKILAFIQFSQPQMESVYNSIMAQSEKTSFQKLVPAIALVYKQTYKQVNHLFEMIDEKYESNPTQELYQLLRQCNRLRATVSDICSILHQIQPQESYPTQVTDEEIHGLVEATVRYYGEKA